jgi:hypothetical protein
MQEEQLKNVKLELQPNSTTTADVTTSSHTIGNTMLHAVNRHTYRPTKRLWQILVDETDLEPYCSHSQVELINFETNKIHLKGGARLSFTGLSEQTYLGIVSGF